jgi:hypothetical protein
MLLPRIKDVGLQAAGYVEQHPFISGSDLAPPRRPPGPLTPVSNLLQQLELESDRVIELLAPDILPPPYTRCEPTSTSDLSGVRLVLNPVLLSVYPLAGIALSLPGLMGL